MRKIIVLSNKVNTDGSMLVKVAFWLSPPVSIQQATPNATSQVTDATAAELTALSNGTVLEEITHATVPVTMSTGTIGSYLTQRYNDRQVNLDSYSAVKNYTGTYWDGTSWFNVPA